MFPPCGHIALSLAFLEIRRSKINAWSTVDKREYYIIRAYTFDPSGTDILLLGQSNHSTKGRHTLFDFTCRMVFEDTTAEIPKIKLLQIWPVGFTFPSLVCFQTYNFYFMSDNYSKVQITGLS